MKLSGARTRGLHFQLLPEILMLKVRLRHLLISTFSTRLHSSYSSVASVTMEDVGVENTGKVLLRR